MHVVLLWLERHAVTLLALFRVDEFGKRWVQVQVWQEVETSASYLSGTCDVVTGQLECAAVRFGIAFPTWDFSWVDSADI